MEIAPFQYHGCISFPPNGRNLAMNLIKIPSHFDCKKVYRLATFSVWNVLTDGMWCHNYDTLFEKFN